MRRSIVAGLAAAALALSGLILPGVAQSQEAPPAGPGCQFVDVKLPSSLLEKQAVPLPPGAGRAAAFGSPTLNIHGRLCLPSGAAPKTVLLALHGITYTNTYWNVDFQPETYNLSRVMTNAGYAVFAIDRLGYGDSSHPDAQAVTLDAQAEVAHQLIGKLRAGQVGGTAFPFVALVGHSYGTATSWRETSKYNDADAVIGTGWANTIQTLPLARFFTGFIPAQTDPFPPQGKAQKFRTLPPGYFTPSPGIPPDRTFGNRDENFLYYLPNADPAVIRYDNRVLRDTVTDGEGLTFYNRYGAIPVTTIPPENEEVQLPLSNQTARMQVPTFQINGQQELFFCGQNNQQHCTSSQQLQRTEGRFFSPAACFRAAVTPNAGHDLNLQRNAQFTYDAIRTFADQALGPNGENRDSYRASCAAFSGAAGADADGGSTFGPFGGP